MTSSHTQSPDSHAPVAAEQEEPDFVAVDVETACSRVSSICQVGIVGFKAGRELFAYETLVDPLDEFLSFNVRIHGITADHVMGQPTFSDIHSAVSGHISGRIAVAHSFFDKGAIAAACQLHRHPMIETNWLDSVRVAKRAWPQLASHRLNSLTPFLGIPHKHHDALSDARAAGLVMVKAIEHTGIELKDWLANSGRTRSVATLQPAQDGPLTGERIAILGEAPDGRLAHFIAKAGGRVVRSVGSTTTMLVVSTKHPYGRWVSVSSEFRKATALMEAGKALVIKTEEDLRASLFLQIPRSRTAPQTT